MDSSSVTDPSPGPSPESPIAKVAPSSFVADFRSRKENISSDPLQTTFFELQRPTTPAKKPRNLKNLGINTASSLGNLRSTGPTAPLPMVERKEKNTSAPTSPSFIKPPTPPKRRPSNLSLTIQTPGSDSKPTRLIIPSTPSNRPGLRHFQSSPSLPLCSPNVLPSGGMKLPALRPIKTNPHGFAEVQEMDESEDQEPNFDIPQSREEKPAAYPNGPICIYESGVYLYFEPTAEQAATFDVIVNVASEVKNPFTDSESVSQKELDARRIDGPPAENVDFAAIASSFSAQGSSPTTPKATPVMETIEPTEKIVNGTSYKTPEYIHMMWEHNTDIVQDLFDLVKTMDARVQQGKRVLVHCQCGVSRSASLIVAYGLYKNPGISVQEAYDAVKKRSKWIGPNMNLIMQLQEFRNKLLRMNETKIHNQGFGLPRRSAGLPSAMSNGTNIRSPFNEAPTVARTPRTAPLPPDDMALQRASTGNMFSISPGPLSAPSGAFFSPGFRRSWASSRTHFDLSPKSSPTALPSVDLTGHVVPVLSITDNNESKVEADHAESENGLKPLPVPNFSRQLPFRNHPDDVDSEAPVSPRSGEFHLAPIQPSGVDSLLSPSKSSFDLPPLKSPMNPSFNIQPVPFSDHLGLQSAPTFLPQEIESSMSPRSTEFHMTGLNTGEIDDSFGLLSPRATSFDLEPRPVAHPASSSGNRSSRDFDVSSPTITEFPKDVFSVNATNAPNDELASPRATEFHMTPLKPRVADEDPFGVASPRQFEFPNNAFDSSDLTLLRNADNETRRPSFQAILPPSHEAFNGFASLNETAQADPSIHEPTKAVESTIRIDSLSTSPEADTSALPEPRTPGLVPSNDNTSSAAKNAERLFLATPPKQLGLRTRFSSPNMREQRRLHKLQTEMEAMLPHKSPVPTQSADDLDALMSPRAEEFTRNPFHFDLRAVDNEASPASSNETIKDGQNRNDWKEPQSFTPPRIIEDDPRSPVQTGSSPIVRNIWDVL
ncbi:dual specificity phosphatase [Lophiotrema nucula]|uniref:protein-tyrosine-phosphatase n=1 Tax=Lophiotrema nucula TaxID=690887 RepID=A0A6A5Z7X7_9PLEO|nr:dual specificity phosphatase [Lophiotrema nucula]